MKNERRRYDSPVAPPRVGEVLGIARAVNPDGSVEVECGTDAVKRYVADVTHGSVTLDVPPKPKPEPAKKAARVLEWQSCEMTLKVVPDVHKLARALFADRLTAEAERIAERPEGVEAVIGKMWERAGEVDDLMPPKDPAKRAVRRECEQTAARLVRLMGK